MKKRNLVISFAVGFAVVLLVAVGCEKTQTGVVLEVTPQNATIQPRGAITLTVSLPEAEKATRKIYYPLIWSVSDPQAGGLRDVAGNSAVYYAGDVEGVNSVTVRDQLGAEGIASVTQTYLPDAE